MSSAYVKHQLINQTFLSIFVRSSSAFLIGLSLLFFQHPLSILLIGLTWLFTGCSCLYAGSAYRRQDSKDTSMALVYFSYGGSCSIIGLILLAFRESAVECLVESNAALLFGYAFLHLVVAWVLYLRHKRNQPYSFVLGVPAVFAVCMIIAVFTPVFSYETWISIMGLANCFYSGFAIGSVLVVKRSQAVL